MEPIPKEIALQSGALNPVRVRRASRADLPRIHEIRAGVSENRLTDPSLVTEAEVFWYLDEAIFLVSEDAEGPQGFACANPQTGFVWALFVIDPAQGRGHGSALLDGVETELRSAGHRQAFLTTGAGTKAETFYIRRGWRDMGLNMHGESVLRLWL